MNNPVTFYKCKVVARMLIGGDAMYRRLLRNVYKHSSICHLCPACQQITIEHTEYGVHSTVCARSLKLSNVAPGS